MIVKKTKQNKTSKENYLTSGFRAILLALVAFVKVGLEVCGNSPDSDVNKNFRRANTLNDQGLFWQATAFDKKVHFRTIYK